MRFLTCALLASATLSAAGQQLTIPEMVASSGGEPVMTSRVFELQDVPLRTLLSEASLIVEGTVSAERSYLSADRRTVYTDYDIIPSRTFFARGTLTQTTPGAYRLVVRKFGGTMKIDGVAVHVLDEAVAPLNVGERILAFLVESSDAGKFDLLFGIGGFVLKDDGVVPLVTSHGVLSAVRGMTPSQFSEFVAEEVATRHGSPLTTVSSTRVARSAKRDSLRELGSRSLVCQLAGTLETIWISSGQLLPWYF